MWPVGMQFYWRIVDKPKDLELNRFRQMPLETNLQNIIKQKQERKYLLHLPWDCLLIIWKVVEAPPALNPKTVTFDGSPPK